MIKAINYWSFPGGLEGTLSPFDAIRHAAAYRFPALELAIGDVGSALGIDADERTCRDIADAASEAGVALPSVASGLYWSRNLGDADPAARSRALDDLERLLRISHWLGARTLLTIPGAVDVFFMPERAPLSTEHVWHHATEGIRAAIPTAEACQVRMGIENVWNKFLMSPYEMASFIDQFASPWVGAYVDVANLQPFGYAEDWIRHLGKRVVGVHFKDFRRSVGNLDGFVDLLEGDVDWPAVVVALREVGYEGPVAAEMIPGYRHHPMVRIANTSNAMDAILA